MGRPMTIQAAEDGDVLRAYPEHAKNLSSPPYKTAFRRCVLRLSSIRRNTAVVDLFVTGLNGFHACSTRQIYLTQRR